VPGKEFRKNSVVEFFRSSQEKIEQGRVRIRKTGKIEMRFTGTLIEDLMATVERAEQRAQSERFLSVEALAVETLTVETLAVEAWFTSVEKNADYDSKLLGVA
jgi:hypothetical protein